MIANNIIANNIIADEAFATTARHVHVLKKLFPLPMEGDLFDAEMALQGNQLDSINLEAHTLLLEFFPDTAIITIANWEKRLDITPASGDSLSVRQQRASTKYREIGGLSKDYFLGIAADMGFLIEIIRLQPIRCGVSECGDEFAIERIKFMWQVVIKTEGDIAISELETKFNTLKPCESVIEFIDET